MLLLEAIREGRVRPSDLSLTQRIALREHTSADVRSLAERVIDEASGNRQEVVDNYMPALALEPDPSHGKTVFTSVCAACHQFDGQGFDLGPNLETVKNGGKEKLLSNILDPNREVDPRYEFFQIETEDLGIILGAIVDQTPGAIIVKQAYGSRMQIARSDILSMSSLGRSMMPEGLEASLSEQDMADLIEYILSAET
ncbi:MAG: c-type cytochrome [Opitutaceae bacterium]